MALKPGVRWQNLFWRIGHLSERPSFQRLPTRRPRAASVKSSKRLMIGRPIADFMLKPQEEEARRIALVGMMPKDIQTYVTMHWELPQYGSYNELEKRLLNNVKR